jgi:Zn ribbon nucleic-acid-binding protein
VRAVSAGRDAFVLLTSRACSVVDVLETRMYMLAYAGFYSLMDMIDAYSGACACAHARACVYVLPCAHELRVRRAGQLLPKLTALRKQLDTHVRFECPTCRLAGEQCPACSRDDLLYAFDEDVVRCRLCLKLFHADCYTSPSVCPSCARARQRASVARPLQPAAGPSAAPGR